MQLLDISIKDFCNHAFTHFSFEQFSSALILGKIKNSDRFSNGAGKSNIFGAIGFVLFNETHFSSLEKLIRDGCEFCQVELQFLSTLDNNIYKIIRTNSRKSGTDVRLFRKIGESWEDLTQRRVSDTEKEIIKIVGFNYKIFCASTLFPQPNCENNVQRDFGNLPSLTPEKRKSVLREILQLHLYSNYEKLAKSRSANIQLKLDKCRTMASVLGNPVQSLVEVKEQKNVASSSLAHYTSQLTSLKEDLNNLNISFRNLEEQWIANNKNRIDIQTKIKQHCDFILKINSNIIDLEKRIGSLPEEAKILQQEINSLEEKINKQGDISTQLHPCKEDYKNIIEKITKIKVSLEMIDLEIVKLSTPLTSEVICNNCHQSISNHHREKWQESSIEQLAKLNQDKNKLQEELKHEISSRQNAEEKINLIENAMKQQVQLQNKVTVLQSELKSKRSIYVNYSSLLQDHKRNRKEKEEELNLLKVELQTLLLSEESFDEKNKSKIEELKIQINQLSLSERILNTKVNSLVGELAVCEHRILQLQQDSKNLSQLKQEIADLEKSLLIHTKVVQAFGSKGIPALITHSILDDLQETTNKWLAKFRPGLQLQFLVTNEKNEEDTLDIIYLIDGKQREYRQLSGAQKIIVTLSIKLAITSVINGRFGVDIRFMLLDEVDQALDAGSAEVFADIIKTLQNDIKIMIITHNEVLKYKFTHAVVVEQDENNVSTGKLLTNW